MLLYHFHDEFHYLRPSKYLPVTHETYPFAVYSYDRTECVRLKNFVVGAAIMNNTIKNCGAYDFLFNRGGQNGEGVYIGTSNLQVRNTYLPLWGIEVHHPLLVIEI